MVESQQEQQAMPKVLGLELELGRGQDGVCNRAGRDVKLQCCNRLPVQPHAHARLLCDTHLSICHSSCEASQNFDIKTIDWPCTVVMRCSRTLAQTCSRQGMPPQSPSQAY